MATGVTNVSALNGNWVSQVYEDALFVARARNVMAGLVTSFTDRGGDESRANLEYPQATAQEVGENDDYSNPAQLTKTQLANLTPVEKIAQAIVTDRRISSDPQRARDDASKELGEALADNVESNLLGVFDDFTGGTIGAAGTVMTWGHFFAARTKLAGSKVPGPYACVLHEYQWHNLAKAASVAGSQTNAAAGLLDEVNRRFYVGTVGDVDIFTSANIGIDASDDAFGGMFNRAALAIDWRRMPRLEPERDASKRAWELNFTAHYAHGVWRPTFGVALKFDATAPTS